MAKSMFPRFASSRDSFSLIFPAEQSTAEVSDVEGGREAERGRESEAEQETEEEGRRKTVPEQLLLNGSAKRNNGMASVAKQHSCGQMVPKVAKGPFSSVSRR